MTFMPSGMLPTIALLLATTFPSSSRTSWMRPESFHLVVGMPRAEAMKTLERDGWKPRPLKGSDELTFDYTEARGVTLQFHKERLSAIRFEFFAFVDEAHSVFEEERSYLKSTFGEPHTKTKSLLVYDRQLPNIIAVLSMNQAANARHLIGMVVVRYYDPVASDSSRPPPPQPQPPASSSAHTSPASPRR